MKIQVFSPHFDDAVLSCGEHISRWLRMNHQVEVITVFTEFEASVYSQDSIEFMQRNGINSGRRFRLQRSSEDKKAMHALGVNAYRWLSETDGGFRLKKDRPVYLSHQQLFDGCIRDKKIWQIHLREQMQACLAANSMVVVPLGVGQHADHVLVKEAIMQLITQRRLAWYVDAPYFFQFSNWNTDQLKSLLTMHRSILWSGEYKLKTVDMYESQVSALFPDKIWHYPEIILTKFDLSRRMQHEEKK